jgi:DNA-binding MarR family transcriptional regulator
MRKLLDEIGPEEYNTIYNDMYLLDCLACLIFRSNRIITNRLNREFHKTGNQITVEQFRIFLYLWENNGILQSELVNLSGKDKAGIARTLDVMERQDLIVRTSIESDQRQKRILLTNKGKKLKDVLAPVAVRANMDCISMVGRDKSEVARNILRELIAHLGE